MEGLSAKQKFILILSAIIVLGLFGLYLYTSNKNDGYNYDNIISEDSIENNAEETQETKENETRENTIVVHITGAIKNEGIVEVPENSRIKDIVDEAGGLTEDADLTNVNLAYKVKDGQKIYIPRKSDMENNEEETIITSENGEDIIVDYGEEENVNNGKININTATKTELEGLNGIGEGTADKIIEYREANGKFNSIEEIKNVSGIGDAKYENIKNDICV